MHQLLYLFLFRFFPVDPRFGGQGGRQGQALCHFPPSELVPHGVERGRKPSRPPRRGYCRCRSLRPPRHACGGVLCRAGEVLCLAVEVLYLVVTRCALRWGAIPCGGVLYFSVVVFFPMVKCSTLW